jgi:hypothetical protein
MESTLFTLGAMIGVAVTAGGLVESLRALMFTRTAEKQLLRELRKQAKVRDDLISELVQPEVGENIVAGAALQLAALVSSLPQRSQRFLLKGLHQPSLRGRRDFILKLATAAMQDVA